MSEIELTVDGQVVRVPTGSVVAAAIAQANVETYRRSVLGEPRAPLCGMGICYECRVTINGQAHRLSCQTLCSAGMEVVTE
jgi:predicted molibdopterin-dependent oxidoreductase YjgC